jgi:heme exporter protein A
VSVLAIPTPLQTVVDDVAAPVKLVGVSKAIDGRPILEDIDLEVRPGEFLAVLGANGAGKSTLLKVIATLTAASSGHLYLFGRRVTRDSAALRTKLGLIAHQSMLYRDLTARENLEFFARLYGIAKPTERADRLLNVIGLADRADEPIKAFSRGMVQRVAIARALVHDPELILADEPFDGLDAPSVAATEQLLAHLHQIGKTILLVNHDISQSLQIAGRVVVLRRGKIVIDDAAKNLNAAQVLAEVGGA